MSICSLIDQVSSLPIRKKEEWLLGRKTLQIAPDDWRRFDCELPMRIDLTTEGRPATRILSPSVNRT